jgi:hypothetical protein
MYSFNIPEEAIEEALKEVEKSFALSASQWELSPQYLAGLFDGEGCVSSVLGSSGAVNIAVSISQKFPEILMKIAEKFPTKVRPCASAGGKYPYFQLDWGGQRALPILQYIRDFVFIKRSQVEVGIRLAEICNTLGSRGGYMAPLSDKERIARYLLHEELKRLKKCPSR